MTRCAQTDQKTQDPTVSSHARTPSSSSSSEFRPIVGDDLRSKLMQKIVFLRRSNSSRASPLSPVYGSDDSRRSLSLSLTQLLSCAETRCLCGWTLSSTRTNGASRKELDVRQERCCVASLRRCFAAACRYNDALTDKQVMSAGHASHIYINSQLAGTAYGSLDNPNSCPFYGTCTSNLSRYFAEF